MLLNLTSTPQKSKAITALERDLETARKRHDVIAGKLDRAALAAERAATARRNIILENDTPDPALLAKAEGAAKVADETLATLQDASRHSAERIRDLELNLAEQVDRAARSADADQLERKALDVDIAAGDFADALARLAARYSALTEAMRASGPVTSPGGTLLAPELAAMATLDAGVRRFEPNLVPRYPIPGEPQAPTDVSAVTQELVSGPLRRRAAEIRNGGKAVSVSA